MGIVLPMNYSEIEQEEMMYLDGGNKLRNTVYATIGAALTAFVGKAISASLVALAIKQAGVALVATINSAVIMIGLNPPLGVSMAAAATGAVFLVGRRAKYW